MGYSPWGRKESETTEQLTLTIFIGEKRAAYLSHSNQFLECFTFSLI